ncbi:NAD(P)-dependent oxidoreductase [Terrarubrum flagellatum]|uniref:NAD(P)-dependent oxidoreductase n=1 Tax=Terrirubrum flagellatum TaxID=2895980 RepID=UPI003145089C
MAQTTKTIAFFGLGSMGRPMAANLAKAQFAVRGYDVAPSARETFVALAPQATAADSIEAAAQGADALVLMVVNADQAESVLFEKGALEASAPGAIVVVMATCAPKRIEEMAARVVASGRRFVDAPVSGGVVGAEKGALTIMVGAEDAIFAAAKPLLGAMGDKLFHVGARPGQGAMVKTINQHLAGVHIAAAAEAMALAEKAGVDGKLFLDIFGGSAAGSWMLSNRGPRMIEDNPTVASAIDIFVKDLGIVMDAGRAQKAALPIAAAALQMFLSASANGYGGMDDSQVVRVYRALNGANTAK